MQIETWLKNFKQNWQNNNIEEIIKLFSKNLVYYETPFQKITNHKVEFQEIILTYQIHLC